ncbi:MAG TPA: phosphoribosyltransferase family protein [Terracidiphilus sp.]|nr:phosphoribosyltransferase family protein [Terracidiphilus sp.]
MAPPPFKRAVAYGPYESRLKDAIHALKYDGLLPVSVELGRRLAVAIGQLNEAAPAEMLVIPIPLHRSKSAARGFNQAKLLAQHAVASLRRTHPVWRLTLAPGLLVRHRQTGSQAGLTPRQRRLNVRGAFRIKDAGAIAGKDVLVIDDILTTGATARAAAQALLSAGAESVWVATLARAHRTSPMMYGTAVSFEGAAESGNVPGSAPGIHHSHASMYSSPSHSSS